MEPALYLLIGLLPSLLLIVIIVFYMNQKWARKSEQQATELVSILDYAGKLSFDEAEALISKLRDHRYRNKLSKAIDSIKDRMGFLPDVVLEPNSDLILQCHDNPLETQSQAGDHLGFQRGNGLVNKEVLSLCIRLIDTTSYEEGETADFIKQIFQHVRAAGGSVHHYEPRMVLVTFGAIVWLSNPVEAALQLSRNVINTMGKKYQLHCLITSGICSAGVLSIPFEDCPRKAFHVSGQSIESARSIIYQKPQSITVLSSDAHLCKYKQTAQLKVVEHWESNDGEKLYEVLQNGITGNESGISSFRISMSGAHSNISLNPDEGYNAQTDMDTEENRLLAPAVVGSFSSRQSSSRIENEQVPEENQNRLSITRLPEPQTDRPCNDVAIPLPPEGGKGDLVEQASQHFKLGDWTTAEILLQQALQKLGTGARESGTLRTRDILHGLAMIHESQGDWGAAHPIREELLTLERNRRPNKATNSQAYAALQAGVACEKLFKLTQAIKHHQDSMEIYEITKNVKGTISAKINQGAAYLKMGSMNKAYPQLVAALDLLRGEYPDNTQLAEVLRLMHLVTVRRGDGVRARQYMEESLATCCIIIPDQPNEVSRSIQQSQTMANLCGDYNKAASILQSTRADSNLEDHITTYLLCLEASYLVSANKLRDALNLYLEALTIRKRSIQAANHPLIIQTLISVSHVFLALGDLKSAEVHCNEATSCPLYPKITDQTAAEQATSLAQLQVLIRIANGSAKTLPVSP
eukprot:TRINITY_DN4945_c5_g1_i1.p1 TRINITY_DN4945_c5_g1~~TRINITY_DN4945_c5_g1_i1.p1  ORF type:complete len:765 (+),score=102.31 TRINITY_DN4945_c5_g1_i1:42-2297(+)